MRTSLLVLLVLFWFTGLSGSAFADEPVPLNKLIEHARVHAPEMVDAVDDLAVSKHRIGTAVANHLPRLSASNRLTYRYNNPEKYSWYFSYDGSDCDNPLENQCIPLVVVDEQVTAPEDSLSLSTSLMLYQPLFAPKQTISIMKSTKAHHLTEIQVEGGEEQVVMGLLTQYADLQNSIEQEGIYMRSLELAKNMEAVVKRKLDTGQTTELDLQQAALDREGSEQKLEQLYPRRELDAAGVAQDSGFRPETVFHVCLLTGKPDDGETLPLDDATQIQVKEQKVALDELGVAGARAQYFPTINAMGGLSMSGSGQTGDDLSNSYIFDSWYIGGTLSWTLFDGLGRYHDNQTSSIKLRQSRRDLDNSRKDLLLSDRQLAQTLSDLASQRALMERSVSLSEKEADVTTDRYKAGMANYDMVHQSYQKLEMARTQLAMLKTQQWKLTAYRGIQAGHLEDVIERFEDGQDPEQCTDIRAMAMETR